MAKVLKIFSVTTGNPPCLNGAGNFEINGIEGRTIILNNHYTEVTLTFHCPPTGPALFTDRVHYDPATGEFLYPDPIVLAPADNPCGEEEEEYTGLIRILHEFKDGPGGTTLQQLVEESDPIPIICPLAACYRGKGKGPKGKSAAKKAGKKTQAATARGTKKAAKPPKKKAAKKKKR